jgi:hypothetical protein
MITLFKAEPFKVELAYAADDRIPAAYSRNLGTYSVALAKVRAWLGVAACAGTIVLLAGACILQLALTSSSHWCIAVVLPCMDALLCAVRFARLLPLTLLPCAAACSLQADEKRKVKLQVSMNLHGLVAVDSATLYEEEEYEEAVPVTASGTPAQAAAAASEPTATGTAAEGDAPMEAEPAAAAEEQPAAAEQPAAGEDAIDVVWFRCACVPVQAPAS